MVSLQGGAERGGPFDVPPRIAAPLLASCESPLGLAMGFRRGPGTGADGAFRFDGLPPTWRGSVIVTGETRAGRRAGMNVCDLNTGLDQLTRAVSDLTDRWADTKAVW